MVFQKLYPNYLNCLTYSKGIDKKSYNNNNRCHDNRAHPGRKPTQDKIESLYYWLGIRDVITKYLRNCEYCQTRKAFNGVMPIKPIISFEPRECIIFDLTSISQRKDGKGKCYILVCIDHFTKWIWTEAFPSKVSQLICDW
jgi:hypothetical protein